MYALAQRRMHSAKKREGYGTRYRAALERPYDLLPALEHRFRTVPRNENYQRMQISTKAPLDSRANHKARPSRPSVFNRHIIIALASSWGGEGSGVYIALWRTFAIAKASAPRTDPAHAWLSGRAAAQR